MRAHRRSPNWTKPLNEIWFYIVWPLGCYVLGSVSNGDLVARAAGVNIREEGTGNPGTANIWREIGPRHGAAVFLMDLAKGVIATLPLFLWDVEGWVWIVSVMALMIGQIFPVFFGFKGNTGMASLMGCTVGLLPFGGLIAAPIGITAMWLTKNSGWVGLLIFLTAGGLGGWLHESPLGVAAIAAGGGDGVRSQPDPVPTQVCCRSLSREAASLASRRCPVKPKGSRGT